MTSHFVHSIANEFNHPLKPKLSIGDSLINKLRRPEILRIFQKKRDQLLTNVSTKNENEQTPVKEEEKDKKHFSIYIEKTKEKVDKVIED